MTVVAPPKKTWSRRRLQTLGLVIAALLALGAGEVMLRVDPGSGGGQNEIATQLKLEQKVYVPDPEFGALLGALRRDAVETLDFSYTLQTDHAGFVNSEPWPSRADVAVLGNSLLIGPGVGLEGELTTLLEQRLDGRRVMNLGLPGGGTKHQQLVYERFVKPLHPALVVAALWVIWEIDNSQQFYHWVSEHKPDPDYTHYRYTFQATHPSGTPATPSAFQRVWHITTANLARSHLLKTGYRSFQALLDRQQIQDRVDFPNGDTLLLSIRNQKRLAQGMDRPGTPDIREIFFRPLEQLKAEVEAQGARFLVVLVPSKEELYGADVYPAILLPIQEVRAGLGSRGLPVLDLYPTFDELGDQRPAFYRADMHLNALGHQIVADALANWIEEQGIFMTSPPAAAVAGTGVDQPAAAVPVATATLAGGGVTPAASTGADPDAE